jgi:molybdenum cofactor guanylyltransferase
MQWVLAHPERCGGILTPDYWGKRMLYNIAKQNLYQFEKEALSNNILIGQFNFDKDVFLNAQRILTDELYTTNEWLIVDEIGKLELVHKTGLEPALGEVINHFKTHPSDKKLLLVIRDYLLAEAIEHYGLQGASLLPDDAFLTPQPKLTGVVLCGGQSSRMKTDKSLLTYHGKQQRFYVHDMLKELCDEVLISVKDSSQVVTQSGCEYILDTAKDIGPMAGLLAAFERPKVNDVLLVGCDYPFLKKQTLLRLIDYRLKSNSAVHYVNRQSQIAEPLIAVYRQLCYPFLKYSNAQQQYSLKHFLQEMNATAMAPMDDLEIKSVDGVDDFRNAVENLSRK